jgi:hypothetical protein
MRLVLELEDADRIRGGGDPRQLPDRVRYAGRVEIDSGPIAGEGVAGEGVAITVEVATGAASADGLAATAQAGEAPAELRAELERLAAAMARAAVRGARKDGLPPPRRIRRWRELRGRG